MDALANQDILAGKWKQARGLLKQWWGRLTDDDMERISGHADVLIGKVQERYGYTRAQADKEVAQFLEHLNN